MLAMSRSLLPAAAAAMATCLCPRQGQTLPLERRRSSTVRMQRTAEGVRGYQATSPTNSQRPSTGTNSRAMGQTRADSTTGALRAHSERLHTIMTTRPHTGMSSVHADAQAAMASLTVLVASYNTLLMRRVAYFSQAASRVMLRLQCSDVLVAVRGLPHAGSSLRSLLERCGSAASLFTTFS